MLLKPGYITPYSTTYFKSASQGLKMYFHFIYFFFLLCFLIFFSFFFCFCKMFTCGYHLCYVSDMYVFCSFSMFFVVCSDDSFIYAAAKGVIKILPKNLRENGCTEEF